MRVEIKHVRIEFGREGGEGDGGGGGGGLERRDKETRERKWWVVGPGVANHHMSAHGVPGPPPMDATDAWTDWPARSRRERDTYVLWVWLAGRREKQIQKARHTSCVPRPALSLSLLFSL